MPTPYPTRAAEKSKINIQKNAEMRVYDVQGMLVAKYLLSPKHDSIEIDCTSWPSGVYSAVMVSGGLVLKTEKLVIAK